MQATENNAVQTVQSLLALSQQEELVDLPNTYPLSARDDEVDSDGERKHQKLLEAIGSLDGKNGWKLVERSEASLKVTEFSVSSEGSEEKLVLSDLLEPVKNSSLLAALKRQLKGVKSKKTLELPLNKEEVEQIHREVAFNKTSQTLSKWDPIVEKNRQAEQLVFPLEKERSAFVPTEHVLSGWEARTPLEQEVFNLLHNNKQPVTDPLLNPMEKASLKAMSLEEAKMRRAELQRARALQSYYEARARREKKVRSKKYHRIVRKGKANNALKVLDQLKKANPTAALKELENIEKARMMERMNLKHQNSGRWAKLKAVVAKYDVEARRAIQEQLAKSKELTRKLQVVSESEEEERGAKEHESLGPDILNEVQMSADGPNPWMIRSCQRDAKKGEIQSDPERPPEPIVQEFSEREGDGRPAPEEESLLQEFEERRSLRQRCALIQVADPVNSQETKDFSSQEVLSELRILVQKLNKENHQSRKQKASSAKNLLQVQREECGPEEEASLWLQRPDRAQTLEELGELSKERHSQNKELPRPVLEGACTEMNPSNQTDVPKVKKQEKMIDLQNLLTMKSPSVKSSAVPTVIEEWDSEGREQKQVIKEAFAGDDIIRDFLKEKKEAVEANKPKDVDLTLPGWGEWGGMGLKPSTGKRFRFLVKAPAGPPRKDKNLPNVLISEKRNIHAAAHQVQVLPYPFTHHRQFERTIGTPIGSTWNTQRAFQKLTMPKVITKAGHILKPIKAEDVGFSSASRSDLSVIQGNPRRPSAHH
ncbi:U3 small nucleolar RNA-associated protein 14 homolog A-like [Ctenodactylus gundi]